PKTRAIRGNLHRLDDLAERRCPGVEMLDAAGSESLRVQESRHGVELDHRVRDRGPGRKRDAVPSMPLPEVTGLHEEVKGSLRAASLDACDPVHLGRGL